MQGNTFSGLGRAFAVVHEGVKVEDGAHAVAAQLQAVGAEAQAICRSLIA